MWDMGETRLTLSPSTDWEKDIPLACATKSASEGVSSYKQPFIAFKRALILPFKTYETTKLNVPGKQLLHTNPLLE